MCGRSPSTKSRGRTGDFARRRPMLLRPDCSADDTQRSEICTSHTHGAWRPAISADSRVVDLVEVLAYPGQRRSASLSCCAMLARVATGLG